MRTSHTQLKPVRPAGRDRQDRRRMMSKFYQKFLLDVTYGMRVREQVRALWRRCAQTACNSDMGLIDGWPADSPTL